MRAGALICGLLIALIVPVGAAAATPPGNSAVDQYTETYPSAGGGQTSHPPTSGSPDEALGQQTSERFSDAGATGESAADLAAATAPSQAANGSPARPAASGGKAGGGSSDSGDSGALQVAEHALGGSDSGGMGLLLPLILAATAVAALVTLRVRARRAG